jgi:hypothetical protein
MMGHRDTASLAFIFAAQARGYSLACRPIVITDGIE